MKINLYANGKSFPRITNDRVQVMNIYLNNNQFNPRAWYTDGVNSDNIEYDENIKINQLHDETIKK